MWFSSEITQWSFLGENSDWEKRIQFYSLSKGWRWIGPKLSKIQLHFLLLRMKSKDLRIFRFSNFSQKSKTKWLNDSRNEIEKLKSSMAECSSHFFRMIFPKNSENIIFWLYATRWRKDFFFLKTKEIEISGIFRRQIQNRVFKQSFFEKKQSFSNKSVMYLFSFVILCQWL